MKCCAVSSSLTAKQRLCENSLTPITSLTPLLVQPIRQQRRLGTRLVVKAESSSEFDVEAIVRKYQDKFEQAENKPVVIGYGVGAVLALVITEWLIHIPGLDILLGFPIQLVGVLISPLLIIRYVVDGRDVTEDADSTLDKVASLLPGLKK